MGNIELTFRSGTVVNILCVDPRKALATFKDGLNKMHVSGVDSVALPSTMFADDLAVRLDQLDMVRVTGA